MKHEVKRDRDGQVKCRVCRCTETNPCNPPCAWARGERDLCTSCSDVVWALRIWMEGARMANLSALMREVLADREAEGSNAA
jgi:hypothetical protein